MKQVLLMVVVASTLGAGAAHGHNDAAHAAIVREHPEMAHAEPNTVRVEPGAKARMARTFDNAGRFTYACLVPGHFEAGMKGDVKVE